MKRKNTWAIVANRGEAHIYELRHKTPPKLIDSIANPRGRLTNREMDSDRPGRIILQSNSWIG